MSNRLPVIDILKDFFSDYQKFFITYDKAWYEIVKQKTQGEQWKYIELYFKQTDTHELPIKYDYKKFLDKAKEFKDQNDYKASIIYLRTAFEEILKIFCEKKKLKVRYTQNPKNQKSEDFWQAVKEKETDGTLRYLTDQIISDIELYRSIIINPLCHSIITEAYKTEVEKSISAIEKLDNQLNSK